MKRPAIWLALGATVIHLVAAMHYGYFRDELYFVACARHLAWGYVDQPPLVAMAAWLAGPFGYALPALRLLPALAAGATVFVTCLLVRRMDGNRFAEIAAGVIAFLLPANLFLGSTLTTTSFEPFTWTLAVYLLVCIVARRSFETRSSSAPQDDKEGNWGYWYALAAAFVFAFYAKYSILLLFVALGVALLITRERRLLFDHKLLLDRRFLAAVCVGILGVLPNLWWQGVHGWPIVEVLHNDVVGRHAYNSGLVFQTSGSLHNALLFALEQIVFTNPLLVPIWGIGLIMLLVHPRFAAFRFIGVSYVLLFIFAILLEAKSYYIAGIYPALCAAGIVFFSASRAKYIVCVALPVCAVVFVPFALPVLSPQALISYELALGIKEARGNPPRLAHPLFAEEFGWDELAQHVGRIYHALPASERNHAAIFADTYGDAGALDFYGPRYDLPPALSGQNSYYLWSAARLEASQSQPSVLIAVGATQENELRASFREVRMVDTYLHPYRWSAEGPTPIFLCRDPVEPLGRLWPRFRWYGA